MKTDSESISDGNVYGAEADPRDLTRYAKK
jgi:hypothetical protein